MSASKYTDSPASQGLLAGANLKQAFSESIRKFDPRAQLRNPVMFSVWVASLLMLGICAWVAVDDQAGQGSLAYNLVIALILALTLWLANLSEALAEAKGKAQAETLRKTRIDTPARRLRSDGATESVRASELRPGDRFRVEAGELIATDGEIVEGLASIDESAITGESAPVVRGAGGDRSGVTGGTRLLSDRLVIEVTRGPGQSFLDQMIALVEGASRRRTPNEVALSLLLSSFTVIFLIVVVAFYFFGLIQSIGLSIAALAALFVCLIPTTIGGLLSAIGIAGMNRALQARLVAKSGRAVETAGDVDTLLLDKTGTITLGARRATAIYPAPGVAEGDAWRWAALSSLADETPEGQSIVEWARTKGVVERLPEGARFVPFTAETRTSGLELADGASLRKGAFDAMKLWAERGGHAVPDEISRVVERIAMNGGTPLALARNGQPVAVIELQDIIKPGIHERFERLRRMGIRTVMVTGDNPLTAAFIARQAGVDDFIAEARPQDKMAYIKAQQELGYRVAMMGDGTNDAPALAQADVGVAMHSGTQAAKEAGNIVDLDNDPTKLIEVVEIGKQLLMTRGALTTFSIANDVAKYFALVPAMLVGALPAFEALNVMGLASTESAILSALIFNALIIPALVPLALRGVSYRPAKASQLLSRNLLVYGLGGLAAPFVGIKLIDLLIALLV